jgi:signal transduction histidine kinase
VFSKLKYWWRAYSLLGVDDALPYPERRRQIMSNHLNIAVIVISLVLLIVDTLDKISRDALVYSESTEHEYGFGYRFVLAIILAVINLNLAETRYQWISRVILVFGTPYIYLILPLQIGPVYNELYLWYPYAGIPFIGLPLILFDAKKEFLWTLLAMIAFFTLPLFASHLLDFYADRDMIMQEVVSTNSLFYRIPPTAISVFVAWSVYYFVKLNDGNAKKLDIKNSMLSETLLELKKAQNQLIKNEKMAVVGRMSSELTHEMNTPISAIKANLNLIAYDQKYRLKLLRKIGSKCTELELDQLASLIQEMGVKEYPGDLFDLPNEQEKERMTATLRAEGLTGDLLGQWRECLLEIGVLDPRPFKDLMQADLSSEIIDFIIGEYQQDQSFRISNEAISQAEKLIYKLKSYAYSKNLSQVEPFSWAAAIYNSLDLLKTQMKDVEVEIDLAPSLPSVLGQVDEIKQVINNILMNALQAMGGYGKLIIQLREENDAQQLIIEDTGGGISSKHNEEIFEAFFTTKEIGEGTGLGLHICKQIIEKHKGKITWSNTSEGARFVVTLPAYMQIEYQE